MATLGMRQQLKYQYGYSGNLPPRSLEHLGKIILDGFFKLEQLRGLSGILSDKDGLTERIWATILSPEADRLRSALKRDDKKGATSQIRPTKAATASSSSPSSSSSATLAPSSSHDEELQRQHEGELEVEEEGEMVILDSRTQVEKVADDKSDTSSSVDSSDDSSVDSSDDSSDIDDSTNNDNDNTTDNNGGGDDDSDIIVLEPLDSLLL